jgi:drug/metabolite transporter (DMT)-like permease
MVGEGLALFSAACFGLAGATIARGARDLASGSGRGASDNGAFLSILFSTLIAAALWAMSVGGTVSLPSGQTLLSGVALFVIAGLLSTVLGRLTMFRSVVLSGATRSSLMRRLIPVFAALFAWVFLGETLAAAGMAGMGLVLAGVLLAASDKAPVLAGTPNARLGLGLPLGAVSSAFYGGSYVARKLGMVHVPDAAFGALVGALTGIVWYTLAATASTRHRQIVMGLWRNTGRWQIITAAAMASGQTALFFALAHTDVATVAIIGATESFLSAVFAAFVFRTEAPPGVRLIVAAMLALVGVGVLVVA